MKKCGPCDTAICLLVSSLVFMSVGIWTSFQSCDVYTDQLGCAIGKSYRAASEIGRRYDAENTTVTVNYCSSNVYRCDSIDSYGFRCSGEGFQCTWSLGNEPIYTVPKVKHIVVANTISNPMYSYAPNVCIVDDKNTFQQFTMMQKITAVLLSLFILQLAISILICCVLSKQ
jgi:hypothetical protein